MDGLVRMPSYVRVSSISTMAVCKLRYTLFHLHFRLNTATFNISLTLTYDSLQTSAVMLLDPENIGMTIGITLLSYIQAEIYDISYPLQVAGRHHTKLFYPNNIRIPLKFHIYIPSAISNARSNDCIALDC